MARRPQVGLNLPEDVHQWVLETEKWMDQSKTRIGLAGLVLFETAAGKVRMDALVLASLLDRRLIEWSDVREYADAKNEAEREFVLHQLKGRVKRKGTPLEAQDKEPFARVLMSGVTRLNEEVQATSKTPKRGKKKRKSRRGKRRS